MKNLDRALRASSIEFKNIRGPEGLGGLTRAFIEFFGNIQTVALNTLTDIERLVEGTFSLVKQDFREFFQALDNIVIFEGQEVRDAFRDMIQDLADQVKTKDIGATELFRVVQETIDAVDIFSVSGHVDRSASSILNITGTKTVNARDIFRFLEPSILISAQSKKIQRIRSRHPWQGSRTRSIFMESDQTESRSDMPGVKELLFMKTNV